MAPCPSTKKGSFLPLDDVLRVHIHSAEVMELPFNKMAINNLITNMKREKLSDDDIYDAMMELFPTLGCPVWWYEHVTEHDPTHDAARRSEQSVR